MSRTSEDSSTWRGLAKRYQCQGLRPPSLYYAKPYGDKFVATTRLQEIQTLRRNAFKPMSKKLHDLLGDSECEPQGISKVPKPD